MLVVHLVGDRAGLFGALAPMLWIVDGNFWLLLLLLLLLLLQPPFGTSRQFLIVVGNTKRPAFRIWNGHFVSDDAGLFGALAPILRIIDRNFGHWVCSSNRSWRRSRSRWFPTVRQPGGWPPRLPPSRR